MGANIRNSCGWMDGQTDGQINFVQLSLLKLSYERREEEEGIKFEIQLKDQTHFHLSMSFYFIELDQGMNGLDCGNEMDVGFWVFLSIFFNLIGSIITFSSDQISSHFFLFLSFSSIKAITTTPCY
jgi:hypothetical protein